MLIRRELRKDESEQTALSLKINQDILDQAITDTQIELSEPLGQEDYELFRKIHQQSTPQDGENQRFLDLLHLLYILEYRNAQLWYGLNPIVVELLREQGVL